MRRHEVDPVSVLAGLTFLLIAGGYALGQATDVNVRWIFAIPAALIATGAAVLAYVARRLTRAAVPDGASTAEPMD
jgi:ABC-type sulfate transport system permease subunit